MKIQISMKRAVLALAAIGAGFLYAGNVCTWTGTAGDGLVSSAANWDVAPVSGNGDTLVLSGSAMIRNDIPGLSVGMVKFTGPGKMTFAGGKIVLTEPTGAWSNTCPVVCKAPVTFVCSEDQAYNTVRFGGPVVFDGDVSVLGGANNNFFRVGPDKTVSDETGETDAVFNGRVFSDCVAIDVDGTDYDSVYFNGPVEATRVCVSYQTYGKGNVHFRKRIEAVTFNVTYGTCVCDAENVLCPTSNVSWVMYHSGGRLDLNGFNQRCARLSGRFDYQDHSPVGDDRSMTSETPATLTVAALASDTTYVQVNGQVSIDYAPEENKTQTFAKRVHGTSGGIRVAHGTVKMDEGTVWTNLKSLDVGATGTLTVADTNGSENPFPALEELHVSAGGTFKLPAGVAVTVAEAVCGGAVVEAGKTYSGVAAEGVEQVSWIEGAGTVTVSGRTDETRWIGPLTGGAWGAAENWTAGVPAEGKTARFLSDGGDCTVVLAATDELPSRLRIDNFSGTTTVSVASRTASWNPASVQVNRGGRLVFGEETAITVDGTAAFAVNGGEIRLKGESFAVQNFTGSFKVGGSPAVGTGSLTLEDGTFRYGIVSNDDACKLEVSSYGVFRATGGTVITKGPSAGVRNILLTGGTLDFGNDAALENDTAGKRETRRIGDGEYRFTGSSVLDVSCTSDTLYVSPLTEGGTAKAVLRDQASVTGNDYAAVYVGEKKNGLGVLDLGSDASHVRMGNHLIIGAQDSRGEFFMSDGFTFVGYRGVRVGGASEANTTRTGGKGRFVMSGGTLSINGQYVDRGTEAYFKGFVIGDGMRTTVEGACLYEGEAEISGEGCVTNRNGPVIIGGPRAAGRMTMSGGKFFDLSAASGAPAYFCVGVGGGSGAVSLSGGTMTVASRVFVGGCLPGSMFNGSYLVEGGLYPVDAHDAVGSFEFSGGTFSCGKNFFVGEDGRGRLSVVGSGADISIGEDLVLSNTVVEATGETAGWRTSSELAFTFDADGVSPLQIAGRMINTAGTKLTVDLGDWEGDKAVKIAEFASYEGPALTAEFTGARAYKAKLVAKPTYLAVKLRHGFTLTVR